NKKDVAGLSPRNTLCSLHDEGLTCGASGASLYQRSRKGRFRSGQTGQTVNLLALRLRWFESSPAQVIFHGRISLRDHVLIFPIRTQKVPITPISLPLTGTVPKTQESQTAMVPSSRTRSPLELCWRESVPAHQDDSNARH